MATTNRPDDAMPTTAEIAENIGIEKAEWAHVTRGLGRVPTFAELGVFSAMFSEHCSYKSSKPYLKRFPTTGRRVLQGPGENAGVVSVAPGWAVAFKMESHNHPSFIEPFQGAATGVGGILRDVFTMGARPIASMNGLCFGDDKGPRLRDIVRGVVRGVGDYGNCVGVPTVGGQTFFHACYRGNPLVNAFTLGLLPEKRLFLGTARGPGNLVVYVGAKTGRDGVHGATMSSKEFSSEGELDRPTVQVGDPFTEKLLLEATLEAMEANLIVGIQDMGAAGITSSSFEMASRAGTGLELELDRVPARETGMSAYELLLSESQERMLLVAEPRKWDDLRKVFDKWDLHAEVLGTVVTGDRVRMRYHGKLVVDLPVALVADPLYPDRPFAEPKDLKQRYDLSEAPWDKLSLGECLALAAKSANFADVSKLVEQYDSMVGNRTEGGTFDDASIVRLRDIPGDQPPRLALTTDCNPRVAWLDPREGGRRAVCEAVLNIAVRGAEPIGLTDCLNFGSPKNPEVMWQFKEVIEGIREACLALEVPVVSGNVSLYNETDGVPIYPTPMIGMVGLLDGKALLPHSSFFEGALGIGLLGPVEGDLGGSTFVAEALGRDAGKPSQTEPERVARAASLCRKLSQSPFPIALHDVSDGGLFLALLEMAFRASYDKAGFQLKVPTAANANRFLFGEALPRILIVADQANGSVVERMAASASLPFQWVGTTTRDGQVSVESGKEKEAKPLTTFRASWDQKVRRHWEDQGN